VLKGLSFFCCRNPVHKWRSKILPHRRVKGYNFDMTKLLDQALEAARGLPPAMQDDMARIMLQFAGDEQPVLELTPEEDAALARSEAAAARGEFATDAEVRAVWSKHGL
jgi:hypothetical protein